VYFQLSIQDYKPLSSKVAPSFFAPPAGYKLSRLEEKVKAALEDGGRKAV
jgi:hypothetical protein